jgi:hypothetical protein
MSEGQELPVYLIKEMEILLYLTSGFNEVAEGDLGGETCKVSEPLNSC